MLTILCKDQREAAAAVLGEALNDAATSLCRHIRQQHALCGIQHALPVANIAQCMKVTQVTRCYDRQTLCSAHLLTETAVVCGTHCSKQVELDCPVSVHCGTVWD